MIFLQRHSFSDKAIDIEESGVVLVFMILITYLHKVTIIELIKNVLHLENFKI